MSGSLDGVGVVFAAAVEVLLVAVAEVGVEVGIEASVVVDAAADRPSDLGQAAAEAALESLRLPFGCLAATTMTTERIVVVVAVEEK